jgi:hypothetical protein
MDLLDTSVLNAAEKKDRSSADIARCPGDGSLRSITEAKGAFEMTSHDYQRTQRIHGGMWMPEADEMRLTVASEGCSAVDAVSVLESAAWVAWNASYHAEDGSVFRNLGRAFYQEALHERIATLFAKLDTQNARLDALYSDPFLERR